VVVVKEWVSPGDSNPGTAPTSDRGLTRSAMEHTGGDCCLRGGGLCCICRLVGVFFTGGGKGVE
jgi:hypothetical protein